MWGRPCWVCMKSHDSWMKSLSSALPRCLCMLLQPRACPEVNRTWQFRAGPEDLQIVVVGQLGESACMSSVGAQHCTGI